MAISVDTVYQKVLALANKEQRGYITPQEFNLFASQAQMDIFQQYFYDVNQFGRIPGNNTLHSDPLDILEEKIEIFHVSTNLSSSNNIFDLPADYYKLTQVGYNNSSLGYMVEVEKMTHKKFMLAKNSPLTAPSLKRPAFYLKDTTLTVEPSDITSINTSYIRVPIEPDWNGYNVSGAFQYNVNSSEDFELHPSEESKLVIKILSLAGITLKDPNLYQAAAAEDNKRIQQEKQ